MGKTEQNSPSEESKSPNEPVRNWPYATHTDPFIGKCIHDKTKDEKCQEPHDTEPPPIKRLTLVYA